MTYHDPIRPAAGPETPVADGPGRGDVRDRVDLLRIVVYFAGPCYVLLSFLWYFLVETEAIPPGLFPVLLVLNIPLTVLGIVLINRSVASAATGLVRTIYSAGDIAPPRTYPRQETMIIRGQYADAAAYYRDHLTVEPDDNEARLRLADLLERHLHDAAGAERLYLEVRARRPPPTPREAMAAANGLIDLYRRTGDQGRLKVELARFASTYRGARAAVDAERQLQELKNADRPDPGRGF